MDPERLRWLRELIRSIPGYGKARDVARGTTEVARGVGDAAQTFATRTIADAEGSYNFFMPEALESDYFGQLEEDTARRLAEEDRSGLRVGGQIAGELAATGAEYIGLGGAARKGATGLLRREVAEEGAGRLSRMGVSAREALRDAAAVAPLDAVSAAREGHSTADAISQWFPDSKAGEIAGDVAETMPGRVLSEMVLGLGADAGLRTVGHGIGAAKDGVRAAGRGLREMGTGGHFVGPEHTDLFGNPVEPTVQQGDLLAGDVGTTAAQDRALAGRGIAPEEMAARATNEVPEGEVPLDLFGNAGAADPALVAGIARTGLGATAGAAVAPEGEKLEGALAGGALAAGAPALARGLRQMDPVGGWLVPDAELVRKFRASLADLSDDEVIARYQQYTRGRTLTESDATASIGQDMKRRVDDSANVGSGLGDRQAGMNARGRDTQQRARLAAAEAEMRERGIEPPTSDPYLDVKPSQVTEANRELVQGIRTMSDDEIHAEIARTVPKANPSDNVAMERMALLHAEAGRAGREVDLDRALNGEPPIKRPGIAPAFQKAPEPRTPRVVSLRKAEGAQIRQALGLDQIEPGPAQSFEEAWDQASESHLSEHALEIAQDANAQGRALRPDEHAAAVQAYMRLDSELQVSRETLQAATLSGNDDIVRREMQRTDNILRQIDELTTATDRAGSEAGRALSIRRLRANADDYTLARGLQEARTKKGVPLVPAEIRQIEELTAKVAALDVENAALKDQAARLEIVKQEQLAIATAEAEAKAARRTRAPNRIKKLEVERVDLKAQLAKLGVRLNDLTGVSAEGVYLIGKLAKNHIEMAVARGAQNVELNQIVDDVLKDLNNPALTARDIHEALNARGPKAVSEQRRTVQATVTRLKSQARLLTQLEDAENGLFQPGRKRPPTAPEIERLRSRLGGLRRAAYQSGAEARRIERAIGAINDLSDKLANHARAIRKKQPIPSEELANLQTRMRGLRQEMRVEDSLADLNHQLETGEFKQPYKPKSAYSTPELERNQIALKKARQQWRDAINALEQPTARTMVREGANFLRTVKATADMSATLRQGLWLSTSRPATAMRAFGQSARAFFSQNTADVIDNAIRQHPNQLIRDMAGLELADLDGAVSKREEMFASKIAERIPLFGDMVRASNRSMTTTLNLLRTASFDQFLTANPNATTDELKAWANWVNVASGRGDLGRLQPIGTELSTVIFAPRFAASRIQTPFMVLKHWQQPRVRRAIAKDMASTVGLGLTALVLADAAGLEVGVNPRESDFGKIRFGDTRIDLWGGVQQPVRLLTRVMLRGTDEYGLTGDNLPESEKSAFGIRDLVGQFAAFKLAPGVTVPLEMIERKTAVGEDTEPSETAMRAVLPLLWEDVYQTYKLSGPEAAMVSGGLNFLGASTQTFGDSEAATRRKIRGALQSGDTPEARQLLQQWNQANPMNPIRRVQ